MGNHHNTSKNHQTIKPTIAFIILITSAGAMIVGAIINVMLDYHFNY
jgi:hypothetical protein